MSNAALDYSTILPDDEFEAAYQEILAEHIAGDCPEDCAFCYEDALPLRIQTRPAKKSQKPEPKAGYRFTFGKHKGRLLSEVPRDYLIWIQKTPRKDGKKYQWLRDAKQAVAQFLEAERQKW